MPTYVDTSVAQEAIATVEQYTFRAVDRRSSSAAMKALGTFLAGGFNKYVFDLYAFAPKSYHHVFEWGVRGTSSDPDKLAGKLWRISVLGAGNSRYLAYTFRASKVPVPINPNLEGKVQRKDIFVWKAPVMENGTTVRIAPIGNTMVKWNASAGKAFFFKKNHPGLPFINSSPGGRAVQGSFGRAWSSYSLEVANQDVEKNFVPKVEKDVLVGITKEFNAIGRKSTTRLSLGFKSGAVELSAKEHADRIMKAQTRAYGRAAQNRRYYAAEVEE